MDRSTRPTQSQPTPQVPRPRVLIVEDHPAVAEGLAALLGGAGGLEVVGIGTDLATADRPIDERRPDVVLCDVMLDGRDDGFELLRRHHAAARFVMFSGFDYPAHHVRAVTDGAAGYLPKLSDTETVVQTLLQVADGGRAFSREVLRSARMAPKPPTGREQQLLGLLADGASNETLATALGVRVKTIEGMIRRLFDRYGVENRTQLARFAMRQGWLASERAAPARRRSTGTTAP